VIAPEVPVTVTVYVPGVVVTVVATVSTSVPDAEATVGAARAHVAGLAAPLGLDTEQARSTVDEYAPIGVTVIVEVLADVAPAANDRFDGLGVNPKLVVTVEPVTTALTPRVWT